MSSLQSLSLTLPRQLSAAWPRAQRMLVPGSILLLAVLIGWQLASLFWHAVGSGSVWQPPRLSASSERGAQSTQERLGFLPETRTDFVFAVVAERWGLVGAVLVLSLYALLIWRALRIVTLSKNLYGSLIAAGVGSMLMFQVFVNVGMTLGLMPITGLTLPLMSYGGSSVLSTFLAIGLLQSVYVQAQRTSGGSAQPLM